MLEQVVEVGSPNHAAPGQVTYDHAVRGGPKAGLPQRARDRPSVGVIDHEHIRGCNAAQEAAATIDQASTAEIVPHFAPIGRAEGMDDDAAGRQEQRDRAIALSVAGRRHIGAQTVLVELSAEDRHDLAQAHRKCPSVRRLAVPSLPTIRWS
ncbi:hypothetical protein [Brevundimonas sp.]|uniref:hypothetical protein n=1 Tax=Brevundimonas sp. TaxID=1871086 RepID=UPI002580715C|nr:hypothetical protein [Brevundimonas sp.]